MAITTTKNTWVSIGLFCLLSSIQLGCSINRAAPEKTGLLQPVEGYTGQLIGAATIFVWVFAASTVVWLALKATMGIRVDAEEEYEGLDIGECGMEAYPEFTSSS